MASEDREQTAIVMALQREVLSLEDTLSIVGMKAPAYRQRLVHDEGVVAFGLPKPAFSNKLGPLDLCFIGTLNMIAFHHKTEMKLAAAKLRDPKIWKPLLAGFARAERGFFIEPGVAREPPLPRDQQQYLAIGTTMNKDVLIGIGPMQQAIDQVNREEERAIFMLDLQRIIRMAYFQAAKVDIKLPARLCPDPDDAVAWTAWMDAIDEYLVRAGAGKRKAKAPAKAKSELRLMASSANEQRERARVS